jgi:hypothetical protein
METYSDVFHEQIVKKQKTPKDSLLKAGMISLAVLIVLATFSVPALRRFSMIATLIAMAAVFGAYYFSKGLNLEFEYSVTNNYLDISKIMNKSRRKEMYSIDCKNAIKMGKVELRDGNDISAKADKVVDVTSGTNKDNVYYIIFKSGEKKTKIYFEPNEDILAACKKAVPRVAQM